LKARCPFEFPDRYSGLPDTFHIWNPGRAERPVSDMAVGSDKSEKSA